MMIFLIKINLLILTLSKLIFIKSVMDFKRNKLQPIDFHIAIKTWNFEN